MKEKSLENVRSVWKIAEQSTDLAGRSPFEDSPKVRLVNFLPYVSVSQAADVA